MARKKNQQVSVARRTSTLEEALALPINNLYSRKILEILQPLHLYLEIDQWNAWHVFGEPGVQGTAHFQVGIAEGGYWEPAPNQSLMQWQSKRESGAILHLIHREDGIWKTPYEVALVQHLRPTKQSPIHCLKVTPLWDRQAFPSAEFRAGSAYPMYLKAACGCEYYQRLLRAQEGRVH